ncbi:tetratricopeptide repeat protein 41-like [Convolutriloba macropyga]|uniref:tetratricopeptide repeat protein 41-like n=1 Tax=Convolutriloba macropyga TaxID=536237 RepID=UPI003F51E9BD
MDSKLAPPKYQRLLSHNSKRRLQYQLSEAITPFVSSTFIDFEDEREYLVKKIFPQLNLLCVEKGSRFEPLDLRWGISEAQREKGHLIQSCLDYVRHCSPYFICLLGERYGSHRDPKSDLLPRSLEDLEAEPHWLDKNLVVAAVTGNYSFILNNTDNHFASITELEITYRLTLQNPEKMFFYLRTPIDFDKFNDSERDEKKKKFGSESEYAATRLKNLKRKIRSYVPLSQIREYTTVEELGKLVFDDWSELIANEFFDISTSLRGVAMEMYQEWQAHAAYQQTLGDEARYYTTLNSMLGFEIDKIIDDLYFRVGQGFPPEESLEVYKDCLSLLNKTTLSNYKQERGAVLAVRGSRGSGKSAFLAYLSKKRSDLPKTPFCAGVKVFFHFVGCNSQSEDLANFMTRYIDEMTEYFLESTPTRDENRCLIDSFHAAMCFGPSVIFLDGMDQFASSPHFVLKEVKDCHWLPELLPPGCLLILSTTPHDHSHRALSSNRSDVTFFDLVTPDTLDHKNQILSCHFGPRKKLEERQKQQIIKCELSNSPVFLAALARELQLCGGYMSVDRQVEQYVACSNLRTLWHLVILRWANDYGWCPATQSAIKKPADGKEEKWTTKNNWIIDILRLLCVSRNGLSQEDLIQCLKSLGYRGDSHSVGTFDFMQFRACSQQAVLCRRNGLLYIKHTLVKETVFYFFLNGVCPEMTNVSVNSLSSQRGAGKWVSSRLQFQNVIVDHLLAQSDQLWKEKPYLLEELLWQLRNTGNLSKLVKVLTNPEIFTVIMTSVDKIGAHLLDDVRNYWNKALTPTYDPGRIFLEMVHNMEMQYLGESSETPTQVTSEIGGTVVNYDEQAENQESCVEETIHPTYVSGSLESSPDKRPKPDHLEMKDSSGGIVINVENTADSSNQETAETSSTTKAVRHPSNFEKLSGILTNAAKFLQLLQKHAEAESIYKLALKHQSSFTEYSAEEHSQLKYIQCVLAIGIACARQNEPSKLKEAADWLRQALETVQLLLMVCIGETIGPVLQEYQGKITVELIGISIKQGNLDAAKSLLDSIESEGVLKDTESTFLKKSFYKAVIYHKRYMFDESGHEFEEVLRMYTNRYGPNHENLADVLIAFANLLADKQNFDGFNYFTAEDYYQRALKLKERHMGENHLEVAEVKELLG